MVPRLFTQPLTEPVRSAGQPCIDFTVNVQRELPDPWQAWLTTRALELSGTNALGVPTFRFRTVLVLLPRQQGKTWWLRSVILWWLFTKPNQLVLGVAQSIGMARETWQSCLDTIHATPHLRAQLVSTRNVNGEQEFRLANGSRYKIAANNRAAGRGLSVDLLVLDELREHRDFEGWSALAATTAARPGSLTLCTSNAGDGESAVLNHLRGAALADRDPSLGIFEWSAPDGCALDDPAAIAQANPSLGRGRMTLGILLAALATDPPNVYRVERLCQAVEALDNAFDANAWVTCADSAGNLSALKANLACGIDVSLDGHHVSAVFAAKLPDGRVRIEVAKTWGSVEAARAGLGDLLAAYKPRYLVWAPNGPAAALAAILRAYSAGLVEEIKGTEQAECCMELSALVTARQILHSADPLLDAQIAGVSKLWKGDKWEFTRRGQGHADGVYAAAFAVHVSLNAPAPRPVWASLVI